MPPDTPGTTSAAPIAAPRPTRPRIDRGPVAGWLATGQLVTRRWVTGQPTARVEGGWSLTRETGWVERWSR